LLALFLLLAIVNSASAQRVQFPSMVDGGGYAAAPPVTSTPVPVQPGVPMTAPNLAPGPSVYAAPSPQGVPVWDPYSPTAPAAPAPYSPYAPSPYAPAPYTPGTEPLFSEGMPQWPQTDITQQFQQALKLVQEYRIRGTWLPSMGDNDFEMIDAEFSATLAFPFFYEQAPVLITPGFAFHFLEGPVTEPPLFADLPPRVYDAYLDAGWHPQITPWLGANLGVRVGVYSDFGTFTSDSIRVMGRALGVVTVTPNTQIALGVIYLDRNEVKLLPAGGIIYTPSEDARYELLFPNPKLARRWRTMGTSELWWYIAGEYGGGAWTVERLNGSSDSIDINDYRVMLGIESIGASGLRATFEIGYVFKREIVYRSLNPERFEPNDTLMVRIGVAF
jgi:hypothetical protein